MDGLIELIFERVPDVAVDRLLSDMLKGADIIDVRHSEMGSLFPTIGQGVIPYLKEIAVPAAIFVRAASVTVGVVPIRCPLIRILRYQKLNEVSVLFSAADVDEAARQFAAIKLSDGAQALASRAEVHEYYCGFEPATDERTRLFFKGEIGPILKV